MCCLLPNTAAAAGGLRGYGYCLLSNLYLPDHTDNWDCKQDWLHAA